MLEIPSLLEMLKAGLHFGHAVSKWHPKMAPYIFTVRSGVHIINLEMTVQKLKEALDFVKVTVEKGGTVLFLGTKKQAQEIIKKYAESVEAPYVTERWLGGTITNFPVILKLIQKFKNLKEKEASGELEKYTKKERHEIKLEIEKLEKMIGGIISLEKIPEAIFILDPRKEKTALHEAQRKGVATIAICDTNTNPSGIDYVVPSNDDATKAIEIIVRLVAEAVKEGKAQREKGKEVKVEEPVSTSKS